MNNPLLAVLVLISLPAFVSLVTLIVLSVYARRSWRMRDDLDRLIDLVDKINEDIDWPEVDLGDLRMGLNRDEENICRIGDIVNNMTARQTIPHQYEGEE